MPEEKKKPKLINVKVHLNFDPGFGNAIRLLFPEPLKSIYDSQSSLSTTTSTTPSATINPTKSDKDITSSYTESICDSPVTGGAVSASSPQPLNRSAAGGVPSSNSQQEGSLSSYKPVVTHISDTTASSTIVAGTRTTSTTRDGSLKSAAKTLSDTPKCPGVSEETRRQLERLFDVESCKMSAISEVDQCLSSASTPHPTYDLGANNREIFGLREVELQKMSIAPLNVKKTVGNLTAEKLSNVENRSDNGLTASQPPVPTSIDNIIKQFQIRQASWEIRIGTDVETGYSVNKKINGERKPDEKN
uniref:Uncharacterized protein n=1 Tax=Romanomermis culicivorax TaxID=13658 RepID=A0A915JSJ6_ROMCU